MMTCEQRLKFSSIAHSLGLAAMTKSLELFNTACKLHAYNTLFDAPESIKIGNKAHSERLWKDRAALDELSGKLFKINDQISAMPAVGKFVSCVDGLEHSYISAGRLPDWSDAPEDEAEAIKAFEDYWARKLLTVS